MVEKLEAFDKMLQTSYNFLLVLSPLCSDILTSIFRLGGGDAWEFEIRPCSERLFTDLVKNFKTLLVGPLLSLFQSAASGDQSVVVKDSVYAAMGLSADVVFQSFDFDAFLTSTLVNDVQRTGPGFKVLRRRIAILIGQWVTIKISQANRPLVYQIFQHLLKSEDETNDHVVRVSTHFRKSAM